MSSENNETTRVLLFSDNPEIIDRIKGMLSAAEAGNFKIIAVRQLSAAINQMKIDDTDIVLQDLKASGNNSIMPFQTLYAAGPAIPIIVLVGNTEQGLAENALREGAHDFIVKDRISTCVLEHSIRLAIELKRLKDSQKKQNALLSALMNSSNDAIIFSVDRNYRYIAFNEKYHKEMLDEYNVDIQIGMNMVDLITDTNIRKKTRESIDHVLSGESYTEIQFQPDISMYHELNWGPINLDGKIVGASVFIRDVTERKKTEEEIINLAKFPSENPNPVLRISRQGKLLYINAAGSRFLTDLNLQLLKPVPPNFQQVVSEVLSGSTSQELEIQHGNRFYSFSVSPVIKAGYANLYGRDLTEHRADKDRIINLNNELLQKNAELEQLVYVASHDLRSPLVNVQGFTRELGLLIDEITTMATEFDLPGKQETRLHEIVEKEFPETQNYILASIVKMETLLRGLLKLSRIGRVVHSRIHVDINEIVSGVLRSMEYQIQENDVLVETTDLPPCMGDPDMMNQIFSNLIENAIKYRSETRACIIRISGKTVNDSVVYTVEDNGIGIAAEHQKRVFEIFHRLNPHIGEGEGLGLTIVKKAVLQQGGNIRLESIPDKGSIFSITLNAG